VSPTCQSAIELALRQLNAEGRRLKNIFVGNLSFNTSEDELRQMFEPFGQVDRVSIMTDRDTGRSRGFGFVEMASNEDGEKAITALNGTQVGGRTLNVNEARPKTEHAGGGGRDRGGRGGDRGGDRGGRGGGGGGRGRWKDYSRKCSNHRGRWQIVLTRKASLMLLSPSM